MLNLLNDLGKKRCIMGVQGSGSWCRWDTKKTTDSQDSIDIRWLKKQNCLHSGASGQLYWTNRGEKTGSISYSVKEHKMILNYRHRSNGGDWEDVEQIIHITKTPCHYGGYRKWFQCPNCLKRVAILYGTRKYFLCRHCYNLTYNSSNASPIQRIFDKAEKLRKKKLGAASEGFMDLIPQRPKGQHRSTYNRIVDEICRLEDVGNASVFAKYGIRI
jgi:hypothetical protein